MSVDKIITEWRKKNFKPVYWLEGEEEYFIDKAVNYAEHEILTESESSFNLSIFYGKDANWADVVNACRRYPMFAERQVVLLKEAQQMRDVESSNRILKTHWIQLYSWFPIKIKSWMRGRNLPNS